MFHLHVIRNRFGVLVNHTFDNTPERSSEFAKGLTKLAEEFEARVQYLYNTNSTNPAGSDGEVTPVTPVTPAEKEWKSPAKVSVRADSIKITQEQKMVSDEKVYDTPSVPVRLDRGEFKRPVEEESVPEEPASDKEEPVSTSEEPKSEVAPVEEPEAQVAAPVEKAKKNAKKKAASNKGV
jgi:hypothetical protein